MEEKILKTGIKGHAELTVSEKYSAKAMGSGELDVFATPAMIALIEKAAWTSVAPELEEGRGTVGTKLDVSHIAATPLGVKVRCETELVEADGRRLVFRAEVYDEAGKVGEGVHERFIVDNEKFQSRADAKQGK